MVKNNDVGLFFGTSAFLIRSRTYRTKSRSFLEIESEGTFGLVCDESPTLPLSLRSTTPVNF